MDTLLFTSDFVKAKKADEHVKADRDQLPVIQSDTEEPSKDVADSEITTQQEVQNVERPVDLYKAIFSDDSDDEAEAPPLKKLEDPEKKIEVANTALNRLIAGDFLESLGKELGIEVPPEHSSVNAATFNPQKGTASVGNADNMPVQSKLSSSPNTNSATPASKETALEELWKIDYGHTSAGRSEYQKAPPSDSEKVYQKDKRAKSPSDNEEQYRSSSSEDERSKKRSKRRRHRSSDSSSESSDDDRYRSKERKKSSSREKRSSRKRSKHHKHRRDSPSRSSHYSSERKYSEAKKEKRKSRD